MLNPIYWARFLRTFIKGEKKGFRQRNCFEGVRHDLKVLFSEGNEVVLQI